jgi:LacI family transcriptional regulator
LKYFQEIHSKAMAATISDIAKRSGYSPATISRVMNGFEGVRPEVRTSIEAAAKELGYVGRRNKQPRQGSGIRLVEVVFHRRTGAERMAVDGHDITVGPLAPVGEAEMLSEQWLQSNDFYRKIIDGILHELHANEAKAVLQPSNNLADPALIKGLHDGVEGVLLIGEDGPGMRSFLESCPHPVVLVDIIDVDAQQEQVTSDNFGGIALAVQHLVDLGHRRLGFISGADVPATRERAEAFAYHARRLGAVIPDGWSEFPYAHVGPTADHLVPHLKKPGRPTGLCTCNDYGALAVLRAADRCGLVVPRDLSVVGFDNTDIAAVVTPPLTSIHTASDGLGRMAVRLLLSQGDRPQRGCNVRLPCSLITRASTGPAPQH